MKKFKRVVSAALASCIAMTSAGAANIQTTTQAADMSNSVTINIDNEPVVLNYHVTNGVVDSVTINDDVIMRKGNDVFCNGEKIATITTEIESFSSAVEPYTSWVYGNSSCPSGYSSSDYNNFYGSKWHNITFDKAIAECTMSIILGSLILMVDFESPTIGQQVLLKIAEKILDTFAMYDGKNCVWAYESIFTGGMPYTRKNIFSFYGDKNRNNYTGIATCYSFWA